MDSVSNHSKKNHNLTTPRPICDQHVSNMSDLNFRQLARDLRHVPFLSSPTNITHHCTHHHGYQYVLCTSIFPPSLPPFPPPSLPPSLPSSLLVQCTVLYMYTGVTAYIAKSTCTPTPITDPESDLNSKLQTCRA